MLFHVDFLSNQSVFAIVDKLEKITANLAQVEPLSTNINQQRKTATKGVSVVTVYGRWIIVYTENILNQEDTQMYFFDFRFDLQPIVKDLFSESMAKSILTTQARYDEAFEDKYDTAELTLAELYEVVIQENLFACNLDKKVLEKAKTLGVLPIIQSLKDGDTLKVCFADEIEKNEHYTVNNIYALIHFGGHSPQNNSDNGFVYIKLRDIQNNSDQIENFLDKVAQTGVQFDRVTILERFTTARLN
jgi:hypothetical protein